MRQPGCVYLVGAGPGDPDLLTVKARRLLTERAEIVVYDRLISDEIMDLVPPGTTRIFAGKAANRHTLPQDEINELLVRLARSGRSVVRLKGGDPFVFGRGSEEAEHLARHGIPFEVVPGITAASGCAAYAGIPLTHRGTATGVRYVTGHSRAGVDLDLNWRSLADPDTTLVIYMGLTHLREISRRLITAGLAPETPAAAIASGTTRDQRICTGTLADLPLRVEDEGLRPPVLVVIGHVVSLADVIGEAERADAETAPRSRERAGGD